MYRKPFKPPLLQRRDSETATPVGFDRSYGVVKISGGSNSRKSSDESVKNEQEANAEEEERLKRRPFKKMRMSYEADDSDVVELLKEEVYEVMTTASATSMPFQKPSFLHRPYHLSTASVSKVDSQTPAYSTKLSAIHLERSPLSTLSNPPPPENFNPKSSLTPNPNFGGDRNTKFGSFVKPAMNQPKERAQDGNNSSVTDSYYMVLW
jgi:predicted DNA binding CopG/RHH family protein